MKPIPIIPLAASLSTFTATTFAVFVLIELWIPKYAMHEVWQSLFPGFVWLTWPSLFLGLAEAYAYGWYIALVFGSTWHLLLYLHKTFTSIR